MKHLKSPKTCEDHEIRELDFLLCRDFSHDHLVGALRSLDSNEAVALLDFLTVKIRQCPLKPTEKKAGIEQLTKWMGAVVDAHPTTYTSDENQTMLSEALSVVEEKVKFYSKKKIIKNDPKW